MQHPKHNHQLRSFYSLSHRSQIFRGAHQGVVE